MQLLEALRCGDRVNRFYSLRVRSSDYNFGSKIMYTLKYYQLFLRKSEAYFSSIAPTALESP